MPVQNVEKMTLWMVLESTLFSGKKGKWRKADE
jgi:hypothetical protein